MSSVDPQKPPRDANTGHLASPPSADAAGANGPLRATMMLDGATLTLLPRRAPVGNSGPIRGRPLTVIPLGAGTVAASGTVASSETVAASGTVVLPEGARAADGAGAAGLSDAADQSDAAAPSGAARTAAGADAAALPDGAGTTAAPSDAASDGAARLARVRAVLPRPDAEVVPAVLQPGDAAGVAVFDLSPDEALAVGRALGGRSVLHWDGRRAHVLP